MKLSELQIKQLKLWDNDNYFWKETVAVRSFFPFEEARKFVHSLNLKSGKKYKKLKLKNIPNHPEDFYKDKGWISWSDWLGSKFLTFEEAREFVHLLNLKSGKEWENYSKLEKPNSIPSAPDQRYKNKGWVSWGDWLGTGSIHKKDFLPFEEAREYINSLNFKKFNEWNEYRKSKNKPNNIPSNPNRTYKDSGWISFSDWLGNGKTKRGNLLSFKEAKKFVHSLNFKNLKDWEKYCKSGNKPNNIPASPQQAYKYKGWTGSDDWLGTGRIRSNFLPFEEARKFIHSLKLKNDKEWRDYCKSGNRPNNIPSNPNGIYQNNWISLGDWLGSGRVADKYKIFLPFKEARKFVHSLKLKGNSEWREYCKLGLLLNSIPSAPDFTYKNKGWTSWGDWLGTGYVYKKDFFPFEEARKFVHSLNLKNLKEWNKYCKSGNKPNNIPSAPDKNYKDKGWTSWGDWLGK